MMQRQGHHTMKIIKSQQRLVLVPSAAAMLLLLVVIMSCLTASAAPVSTAIKPDEPRAHASLPLVQQQQQQQKPQQRMKVRRLLQPSTAPAPAQATATLADQAAQSQRLEVILGCSIAAVCLLLLAIICWRWQRLAAARRHTIAAKQKLATDDPVQQVQPVNNPVGQQQHQPHQQLRQHELEQQQQQQVESDDDGGTVTPPRTSAVFGRGVPSFGGWIQPNACIDAAGHNGLAANSFGTKQQKQQQQQRQQQPTVSDVKQGYSTGTALVSDTALDSYDQAKLAQDMPAQSSSQLPPQAVGPTAAEVLDESRSLRWSFGLSRISNASPSSSTESLSVFQTKKVDGSRDGLKAQPEPESDHQTAKAAATPAGVDNISKPPSRFSFKFPTRDSNTAGSRRDSSASSTPPSGGRGSYLQSTLYRI